MPGRILRRQIDLEDWAPLENPPPITIGMGYQFDPDKDDINCRKHGYSLRSGEDIVRRIGWPLGIAPPVVGLHQIDREENEPRFRMLTLDHECHLVDFVFTVRGDLGNDYHARGISYRRPS